VTQREPIDPAVLAVLAATVDRAWPRPVIAVAAVAAGPPPWRFSGRWWTRPETTRRDRPRSGG
jgi:hypothetical protein